LTHWIARGFVAATHSGQRSGSGVAGFSEILRRIATFERTVPNLRDANSDTTNGESARVGRLRRCRNFYATAE
jgi:hypothetical protein